MGLRRHGYFSTAALSYRPARHQNALVTSVVASRDAQSHHSAPVAFPTRRLARLIASLPRCPQPSATHAASSVSAGPCASARSSHVSPASKRVGHAGTTWHSTAINWSRRTRKTLPLATAKLRVGQSHCTLSYWRMPAGDLQIMVFQNVCRPTTPSST